MQKGQRMQTLAIAATKGGTGKTTLVACLAVEATQHLNRVAIADLDPQQSLATWHELRVEATGDKDKPELIPTGAKLGSAIGRVQSQADPPDLLIVDGAPGSTRFTEMAIASADFVLVPCQPTPLDAEGLVIMKELCEQAGKPFAFVLVRTHAKRQSMRDGARAFLKALGHVLDVEVADRAAYQSAMLTGHTGPEKDRAAKAEIAALWTALQKRVAKASR
jgi:chromosome partitioning protein